MTSRESPKITAEVWFDARCPWCYISKRRLDLAVERFRDAAPGVAVEVLHRSFELAPGIPERYAGTEADYLHEYEGVPLERSARMLPEIERIAEAEGIPLRFDGLRLANTRRAHRVFQFGAERGRGEEILDRIFTGYFSERADLADPAVLGAFAADAGLDGAAAKAVATSGEYDDLIDRQWKRAQMLGVNGVPYFLFNGKYSIHGAVSAEGYETALATVLEREFGEGSLEGSAE